jgi:hypothetical protein
VAALKFYSQTEKLRHCKKTIIQKPNYDFICSTLAAVVFVLMNLAGTNFHLIMKIMGHKTEKAFLRYLKMDEKVAAIKLREAWENRKSLLIA